jgi:hypothetical protein
MMSISEKSTRWSQLARGALAVALAALSSLATAAPHAQPMAVTGFRG